MQGKVVAVHLDRTHNFSKKSASNIELIAGMGVRGDAHFGTTVRPRSRVAQDPSQPNLRQIHLIGEELFAELSQKGFMILPGQLGENVTTSGIPLLSLSEGTELHIGRDAIIRLTGLRNPCKQIDNFRKGLLAAVLDRDDEGGTIRKAGVMAIVVRSGSVCPGDTIAVIPPQGPFVPLQRV